MSLSVRENAALSPRSRRSPAGLFSAAGARSRRCATPRVAGGQGASHEAPVSVALRRQPAEGRDGPRAALRARLLCRRRADPGRRRRCPGRDLSDPARGVRPRRARGRRLVRRQGARGPLRRGPRHVARPRRRRRSAATTSPRSGSSVPRCSSRTEAVGSTEQRAEAGSRRAAVPPAATTRRRPWSASSSSLLAALSADPERQLPLRLQRHRPCCSRRRRSGFIALGQTVALLTGGIDLSVGPLAGFLVVVASFFVNDGKSVVHAASLGLAADDRRRGVDRAGERLADPLRQVHPDRRDAGALHRLRRAGAAPAARRRAASSPSASRTRSTTRSARCRSLSWSSSPSPPAWSSSCAVGAGAGSCGRWARRGARGAADRHRASTGRSSPATC